MNWQKITLLSVGLASLLLNASLLTHCARPVDRFSPMMEAEEITPAEYEAQSSGLEVRTKTNHWRFLTPFGQSPGKTISSQEPTRIDGDSVTLGGFRSMMISGLSKGTMILYVIGGLAVIAGIVVAVWLKRVVLGLAVAGGGIALMAVATLFETYPWIVPVGGAVLLAGFAWFLYDTWKGGRLSKTLKAVVTGVENAPEEAQAVVKAEIKKTANGDKAVKAEVTKMK